MAKKIIVHEQLTLESEKQEIDIFFKMSKQLFSDAINQSAELYDITADLLTDFRDITPEAILNDSRIIKILRYSIVPVISQMKLGQLIGLASTAPYENEVVTSGSKYKQLKSKVTQLSTLFNDNLDRQRFLWLNTTLNEENQRIAKQYAKNWTCSLIANQNAVTSFRNWRKDLQETTISETIVKAGYSKLNKRKIITKITDILPGQFSLECRVKGRTTQKADFAIRLKKSKKLMLLEAKAVGVKIDAFKRMKECREKADDWYSHFGKDVICGAVIAGFIPVSEIHALLNLNLEVFWEHRLDLLYDFINSST
ncbi:MAG: XamI family restriction endonuclease [Candidatus Parabeggiatoa sp.]|nr:XamI family restriction endonuclease [Candidatus Parabeggiatoa sp.]